MAEDRASHGKVAAEDSPEKMSLGEHLDELRRRIVLAVIGLGVGVGVSLIFTKQIIQIVKAPYVRAMTENGFPTNLAILDATEALSIYLQVGIYTGIVIASPWIFYQIWKFVSAGLREKEKRYVMMAVPFSAGLFISGAVFFMVVVSYPLLTYFIGFSKWLGLNPVVTFSNHVSFMLMMMVLFGLSYQTPLVMLLLARVGIVNYEWFKKYRRHIIVAIFIFAAMVTGPTGVDQIALAVPMCLLYELGLVLIRVLIKNNTAETE